MFSPLEFDKRGSNPGRQQHKESVEIVSKETVWLEEKWTRQEYNAQEKGKL